MSVAEQATETTTVRALPERLWAVATEFEQYPSWAHDIKEVEVLERDAEGRGSLVRFRTAALGRSLSYTLAYDYSEAPRVLAWSQTRGDLTRVLDGSYAFAAAGDHTDVTYHLTAELVLPVPGFVKRRAEGRIIHTALKELKARAEAASG